MLLIVCIAHRHRMEQGRLWGRFGLYNTAQMYASNARSCIARISPRRPGLKLPAMA